MTSVYMSPEHSEIITMKQTQYIPLIHLRSKDFQSPYITYSTDSYSQQCGNWKWSLHMLYVHLH